MSKHAVVSVINDLVTDQRVDRTCRLLLEAGFRVTLIGRRLKTSLPLETRPYDCLRMRLFFTSGPLFYACFNLRLFFRLLAVKADLLVANDLDTLLPNFLVHKILKLPLIYDTHEIFTAVPELADRPIKRKIWEQLERCIFPKLKHVITVNQSIAGFYESKYGKSILVVRNIPGQFYEYHYISRSEIGVPDSCRILILQGAGINIDRGAEEAVEAMEWVENAILLIVGGGDAIPFLKKKVAGKPLSLKVRFIGKQPPSLLAAYTRLADLALTIDKDTNLNYHYSLPNKLFDYIQAGVPVLASPLPEIKRIVEMYDIGDFIENHDPGHIASRINTILDCHELLNRWKQNTIRASAELTWDNEKQPLKKLFEFYA